DLYALMLESTATVVTASHGEYALSMAVIEPFDAIVLDVLMPGMDGWEVCRRLKSDARTLRVPVIMLTSLDQDEVGARAHDAGAAAVLTKPCPVERLAIAIQAAVQESSPAGLAHPRMPRSAIEWARTRRWTRKFLASPIAARVDERRSRVLNVSYGGL